MGDFPKELFIKTEQQKNLFNRLFAIADTYDWTELRKEQWAIGNVSPLKSDKEFEMVNKLLDLGLTDYQLIEGKIFRLTYERDFKSYVEHNMKGLNDNFFDITKP